ncbi:MAG: AMP-binding protein, partial [Pseudarthrobacter sp.]|nr:AMP-binding protein [Pseudarthrobacter sp.]
FVMYGQTEATARMAYLPPDLATAHPGAIGVPVPGGTFRIDPVDGLAHGELVYSGPNVMLGYAETPADLARGRTVDELRTGDLARMNDAGLYELLGRRSRFVKIVGLRVDLGQVERLLSDMGVAAASTGTDRGLVVAVEGQRDTHLLAKVLAQGLGLPRTAVDLHAVDELPRLATGKIDYPAVAALAAADDSRDLHEPSPGSALDSVRRIFEDALERTDIAETDTFVSLGGDSLSFVAASVRLEQLLGHLPPGWHVTAVRDLEPRPQAVPNPKRGIRKRLLAPVDTSIVLRAVGIIFIVSTHIGLFEWQGMAHVLIAAAGFNFARFQLTGGRVARLRRQLTSVARIVVPSMVFIGFAFLVTDRYSLLNIVLLNAILGPEQVTTQWHFWFIEVIVYILLAMTALLAVPWLHRGERRFPFLYPLALFGAGLLTRFELVDPDVPHTVPAFWLFALGWAVARARNLPQRCLVSALALLTVPGFFENPNRDLTVITGILLLTWLPALPVPRALSRLTALLASASMHIYLVHWLVYPPLADLNIPLAVGASLAAGIAYWAACNKATAAVHRYRARYRVRRRPAAAAER